MSASCVHVLCPPPGALLDFNETDARTGLRYQSMNLNNQHDRFKLDPVGLEDVDMNDAFSIITASESAVGVGAQETTAV